MKGFISPITADLRRSEGEDALRRLVFFSAMIMPSRASADVKDAIDSMWIIGISPRHILNAVGIVDQKSIAVPAYMYDKRVLVILSVVKYCYTFTDALKSGNRKSKNAGYQSMMSKPV